MPAPSNHPEFKPSPNSYIQQYFNGIVYREDLPDGTYREVTRENLTTRVPGTEFHQPHPLNFEHSTEHSVKITGIPSRKLRPTPAWAAAIDDFPRDEDAPPYVMPPRPVVAAPAPARVEAAGTAAAAPTPAPAQAAAARVEAPTPAPAQAAATTSATSAAHASARVAGPVIAAPAPDRVVVAAPAPAPAQAAAARVEAAAARVEAAAARVEAAAARVEAAAATSAAPAPAGVAGAAAPRPLSPTRVPGSSVTAPIFVRDNSPDRQADNRTHTRRDWARERHKDCVYFTSGSVEWLLEGRGGDPAAVITLHHPMQRQVAQNGPDIARRMAEARAQRAALTASDFFASGEPVRRNRTTSSSETTKRKHEEGSSAAGPSNSGAASASSSSKKRRT